MIPGNAQILTCPHCHAHKEVMSLMSGNTFGQKVWSDNKRIAPMLPQVSFVQKCPSCNGYFLMSRQEPDYGSRSSFELGDLSYPETKEAWMSLKDIPDLTENERLSMLIMQVWAYNDKFTRETTNPVPREEQAYINGIIDQLLNLDKVDTLLKAELLREAGRFDESMQLLDNYSTDDSFLNKLQAKIRKQVQASDTRPFLISSMF